MIIKSVNINILQKNIIYSIKRLNYRQIVWDIEKYFLNISLKIRFLIIILLIYTIISINYYMH